MIQFNTNFILQDSNNKKENSKQLKVKLIPVKKLN